MPARELRELTQADLSNEVVHLTGRTGQFNNDVVPAIQALTPAEKLYLIIQQRSIRGHRVFWAAQTSDPVVCFSEATRPGIAQIIKDGVYQPWGLGFSKNFVFQHDGGPAFYVRGDLWSEYRHQVESPRLLAFATRYWPGSDDPVLSEQNPLRQHSEYAHEREWRVPLSDANPYLTFQFTDVKLLVVPNLAGLDYIRGAAPAHALDHIDVITFAS